VKAIVSNGFGRYPLADLAEHLESSGELAVLITGAVPPPALAERLARSRSAALARLAGRGVAVPGIRTRADWRSELVHQLAQRRRSRSPAAWDDAEARALRRYARRSERAVREFASGSTVYHVRAGYGGSTIPLARSLGLRVVVDLGIAHPHRLAAVLSPSRQALPRRVWAAIENDLRDADAVLVNSEFVAETCVAAGIPRARIRVAHSPVEPALLRELDAAAPPASDRLHVVHAASLEYRKGIDVVVDVAALTPEADWTIVGEWGPGSSDARGRLPAHVRVVGTLPHAELARLLGQRPLFLFPSRAEGSARVVAEALCAGCTVVTTPWAGSVTRDGIDGRVLASSDPRDFAEAVREYEREPPQLRAARQEQTRSYARARLDVASYLAAVRDAYAG
jgi:glycosyltransferase involved in cell wall biosynthesis